MSSYPVLDSSENQHHGNSIGVDVVPSNVEGGLYRSHFDGEGYVVGPASDVFGDEFTISMFIWRDSEDASSDLVAERLVTQYGESTTRLALGIDRGRLAMTWVEGLGGTGILHHPYLLEKGKAYFVWATFKDNTVVCGVNDHGAVTATTNPLVAASSSRNFMLGSDTLGRGFKGFIDEVAVHPTGEFDPYLEYLYFVGQNIPAAKARYLTWHESLSSEVSFPDAPIPFLVAEGQGNAISRAMCPSAGESEYSWDFVFESAESYTTVGLALAGFEGRLGESENSLGLRIDGQLLYNHLGNQVENRNLGALSTGVRYTFTIDPEAHTLTIRTLDDVLGTVSLIDRTEGYYYDGWRPAASVAGGRVQVNSHLFALHVEEPVPVLSEKVWTPYTSEALYQKASACLIFDDKDVVRNEVTFEPMGRYEGDVEVGLPSITDNQFDSSCRLGENGKVLLECESLKEPLFSVHFLLSASYEDLEEFVVLADISGKLQIVIDAGTPGLVVEGKKFLSHPAYGVTPNLSAHIAITVDAEEEIALFVNGAFALLVSPKQWDFDTIESSISLGSDLAGADRCAGRLSHLSIVPRLLTQPEIRRFLTHFKASDTDFPVGSQAFWIGPKEDIPEGWVVGDGENLISDKVVTPNTQDTYSKGTVDPENVGRRGGVETVETNVRGGHSHTVNLSRTALHIEQIPRHTHGFVRIADGNENTWWYDGNNMQRRKTTMSTDEVGGGQTHNHSGQMAGKEGEHSHSVTISLPSIYLYSVFRQDQDTVMEDVQNSGTIPSGLAIYWNGYEHLVPEGWQLVNGVGSTSNGYTIPDAQDRFIRAISSDTEITVGTKAEGNAKVSRSLPHTHETTSSGHQLSLNQIPRHSHEYENFGHNSDKGEYFESSSSGSIERRHRSQPTNESGESKAHRHLLECSEEEGHVHELSSSEPLFYSLALIVKL